MNLQKKAKDLFEYWKDIILLFVGLISGLVPVLSPYYLDLYTKSQGLDLPTSLLALFAFVMVMVFWPLTVMFWAMMSAFPFAGREMPVGWYSQDPLQWSAIQQGYQKYRNYLFIILGANAIFFVSLAILAYSSLAASSFAAVFDEYTSGLILCFWTIMMCAMFIVFAVRESSKE